MRETLYALMSAQSISATLVQWLVVQLHVSPHSQRSHTYFWPWCDFYRYVMGGRFSKSVATVSFVGDPLELLIRAASRAIVHH
jgi:hypothetical protein